MVVLLLVQTIQSSGGQTSWNRFVLSSGSFAGAACSKRKCGVSRPQTISALAKNQDVRRGSAKGFAITPIVLPKLLRNLAALILETLISREPK